MTFRAPTFERSRRTWVFQSIAIVGGVNQIAGITGLVLGNLNLDPSGGHGVAFDAEGGQFVFYFHRETGGVQSGTDDLSFRGIKGGENSDQLHAAEDAGNLTGWPRNFGAANRITPAPVCT